MGWIVTIIVGFEDGAGKTDEAKKAWWIGAFGGAGPAIVGGMVSLVNEIMLHFAILLGPLFILGLLFEQTKQLFWQWVKSVLGLMLTMGVLAFLCGLVMKISIGYATAAAAAIAIDRWLPGAQGLLNTPSIMETMMVQGGVGLLLSTLLITIPPSISAFVGGTLGSSVNAFTPWGKTGGNPGNGEPSATRTAPNAKAADEGVESPNRTDTGHIGRSSGASVGSANVGTGPVTGNAESAKPDSAVVERRLAELGGSNYALTPNGNVYLNDGRGNVDRRMTMADNGRAYPVSPEVRQLLGQRENPPPKRQG